MTPLAPVRASPAATSNWLAALWLRSFSRCGRYKRLKSDSRTAQDIRGDRPRGRCCLTAIVRFAFVLCAVSSLLAPVHIPARTIVYRQERLGHFSSSSSPRNEDIMRGGRRVRWGGSFGVAAFFLPPLLRCTSRCGRNLEGIRQPTRKGQRPFWGRTGKEK